MHFDAKSVMVGVVVIFDVSFGVRVEEEDFLDIIFYEPVNCIIYCIEVAEF